MLKACTRIYVNPYLTHGTITIVCDLVSTIASNAGARTNFVHVDQPLYWI